MADVDVTAQDRHDHKGELSMSEQKPSIGRIVHYTLSEHDATVLLDGNDTYWACSRCAGEDEGQYAWPTRV